VWEDAAFIGFAHNTPAPANFVDWRKQNQVFKDMAALRYEGSSLTGDQAPEEVMGGSVTPNFFDVLQVEPAMGRRWTAEEDAAKSAEVVISYSLWQRRFGGDPAIVGRNVLMDGKNTKVIGVMPRNFYFPIKDMEYWAPGYFTAEKLAERESHYLTVVARLKPDVTIEQAQQNMSMVAKGLEKQYPDSNTNLGAVVVPIQVEFTGDTRVGLWVLQIASLAVLLIACSNLANLLLARARKETGNCGAHSDGRKPNADDPATADGERAAGGIGGSVGIVAGSFVLAGAGQVDAGADGGSNVRIEREGAAVYDGDFAGDGDSVRAGAGFEGDARIAARSVEGGRSERRVTSEHAAERRAGGGTIRAGVRAAGGSRIDDPNAVEFAAGGSGIPAGSHVGIDFAAATAEI
jgi:hypothetical protein